MTRRSLLTLALAPLLALLPWRHARADTYSKFEARTIRTIARASRVPVSKLTEPLPPGMFTIRPHVVDVTDRPRVNVTVWQEPHVGNR